VERLSELFCVVRCTTIVGSHSCRAYSVRLYDHFLYTSLLVKVMFFVFLINEMPDVFRLFLCLVHFSHMVVSFVNNTS